MDKRNAQPWYVGATHVLTSYVTAAIFAFCLVAIVAFAILIFQMNNENTRIYVSLFFTLVLIPLFLFPATMYSVRFVMNRYVIGKRESVLRGALISIAAFKIVVDWTTQTPFTVSGTISFLLSLAVFYGVSVKCLENNEYSDGIDLKNTVVKEE